MTEGVLRYLRRCDRLGLEGWQQNLVDRLDHDRGGPVAGWPIESGAYGGDRGACERAAPALAQDDRARGPESASGSLSQLGQIPLNAPGGLARRYKFHLTKARLTGAPACWGVTRRRCPLSSEASTTPSRFFLIFIDAARMSTPPRGFAFSPTPSFPRTRPWLHSLPLFPAPTRA